MISRVMGGIEQAFLDYTEALELHHHEVCAVVDKRCKVLPQLQNLAPHGIVPILFLHYNWFLVPYLYFRLKKFAPDLIIVHNKKAVNIFKAVARLLRSKIVAVSHNPKFRHIDKCDGIFTITDYQRNIFIQKGYPAERIFTVPNLISEKRDFTLSQFHQPPIIGTMGRFDPMKGFPDFIDALALLKKQGIAFKAVIGGAPQDAYRAEYEKICTQIKENNLENDVELLGWVQDKAEFFRNIDIFVLPSRFEPFGIVLLEAMLHGKPVVSSLAEGPAEIFAHNPDAAYLFDVGNIEAMADQLKSALQNPKKAAKTAQHGYELCCQNYSLEVVADKLNRAVTHFKNRDKKTVSEPQISVIIPVYNSQKYLKATLQSLQNQTFTDFEAICVDDGSTDNSPQILAQFAADSRFKIHRQTNSGGSAARNTGLELASGKFIAFLDNDDILHPQYLEILYQNIISADADLSCCSYVRFAGEGDYKFADTQLTPSIDFITEQPFIDKFVHKKKIETLMWTKLYRRELFADIRFALDLPAINDMLLNIEILLKCRKAAVCRTPLIAYRIIETSQTLKELSFNRIAEFKNLCLDIDRVASSYPQHRSVLQKIAARYAYGMHIKEYLARYNPAQDTERYEQLRQNLRELQQIKAFNTSKLNLRQRLTVWAFLRQKFGLLRWLKK